jgi:pilus assembly protein Flp/PilA
MRRYLRSLEMGQGLVEYALILVLVAVVVIVILGVAGQSIATVFCDVVIKLGSNAGEDIVACASPRVTASISGGSTVSGNITIEAYVRDTKGDKQPNIHDVRFCIDGSNCHTEFTYNYCMPGGDAPGGCNPFDTHSLANGPHTLHIVATDADGHTGETTVTFNVLN